MDSKVMAGKAALLPVAAFNTGDTANGTEITGLTIDLQGTAGRRYRKARLSLVARGVNTSARQWKVTGNFQDSTATGSGWTDFGATFSDTQLSASGTNDKVVSHEVDLTSAERYLRVQVVPQGVTGSGADTTATGATLTYAGLVELFDANVLPATG